MGSIIGLVAFFFIQVVFDQGHRHARSRGRKTQPPRTPVIPANFFDSSALLANLRTARRPAPYAMNTGRQWKTPFSHCADNSRECRGPAAPIISSPPIAQEAAGEKTSPFAPCPFFLFCPLF